MSIKIFWPFFFSGSSMVWTQDFQVLYCLSHNSSPLCSSLFEDRVSLSAWLAWTAFLLWASLSGWDVRHGPSWPAVSFELLCLGWPETAILMISLSWVAGMTKHTSPYPAIGRVRVLPTFCLGLALTCDLLNPQDSWLARITDLSHQHQVEV
jgi:hypothetical protein